MHVVVENFVATDGSNVTNIGIDLNQAPVPDRKFAADSCGLILKNGTVKFLFGQDRITGEGWRSLVIVQMAKSAASRFLASVEHLNISSPEVMKATLEKYGMDELVKSPNEPPQGHAITLEANLPIVAVTDNDACMDFYQASPFSLNTVIQTKALALEPVVRIDMRSSLFLGLVKGLNENGIKAMEIKKKGVSNE